MKVQIILKAIFLIIFMLLDISLYAKYSQKYISNEKSIDLELEFSFPSKDLEKREIYLFGASFMSKDLSGDFYISDWKANIIYKFDSSGKFISKFGKTGQGPGEFQRPYKVMFTQDFIIVYDNGNHRLQFFDKNHEFIKIVKLFKGYKDMVINEDGLIFAAPLHIQENLPLIDVLTQDGDLLRSFGEPLQFVTEWIQLNDVKLSLNNKSELFVAFKYLPIVRKYSGKGELLTEYKIENKQMKDQGEENKRKASKISRNNPAFWIITYDIEATEGGFIILSCYPDILILDYDLKGKLTTSYKYSYEYDSYYSADFSVKKKNNETKFFILQFSPENKVDVFISK